MFLRGLKNLCSHFFQNRSGEDSRLVWRQGPERAQEVAEAGAEVTEISKYIDSNVSLNKSRYSRFSPGNLERATLLAVSKKRQTDRPIALGGGVNEKNINLIAKRHKIDVAGIETQREEQKTLLGFSRGYREQADKYQGRFNELNKDQPFVVPAVGTDWKGNDLGKGYKLVKDAIENTDLGGSSGTFNPVTFNLNAGVDVFYTRLKKLEREKDGMKAIKGLTADFATNRGAIETSFAGIHDELKNVTSHLARGRNAIRSILPDNPNDPDDVDDANKDRSAADNYLQFIEEVQLEALKERQRYLAQLMHYFKTLETAAAYEPPTAGAEPVDNATRQKESLEQTDEDIKEAKRLLKLENARRGNKAGYYKALLAVLDRHRYNSQHAYRQGMKGSDAYAGRVLDLLKTGEENRDKRGNMQLIMEEYLAIEKELIDKGKISRDPTINPETRQAVIAAAMLSPLGIEGVMDIDYLTPTFSLQEKYTGPRGINGILGENREEVVGHLKANADTLLTKAYEFKPEIKYKFIDAVYRDEIGGQLSSFYTNVNALQKAYLEFYDGEVEGPRPNTEEVNEALERVTKQLPELVKSIDRYSTFLNVLPPDIPLVNHAGGVTTGLKNNIGSFRDAIGQMRQGMGEIGEVPDYTFTLDEDEFGALLEDRGRINNLQSRLEKLLRPNQKFFGIDRAANNPLYVETEIHQNTELRVAGALNQPGALDQYFNLDLPPDEVVLEELPPGGRRALPSEIQDLIIRVDEEQNIVVRRATESEKRARVAAGVFAHRLVSDMESMLASDFNRKRYEALAEDAGLTVEDIKALEEVQAESETLRLEGLSNVAQMAEGWDVEIAGAFDLYFGEPGHPGYWSNDDTAVTNWRADLEARLLDGKGQESHAYTILQKVLITTKGKDQFLAAITDRQNPKHNESLEMLDSIIQDFKSRTAYRKKELLVMGEYQDAIDNKGAMVKEKVVSAITHVFEGITSGDPQKMIMYGALAYLFVSEGIFSKNAYIRNLTRLAGGGLLAASLYEDISGKSLLGLGGIETPDETTKGTVLNRMVNGSIEAQKYAQWNKKEEEGLLDHKEQGVFKAHEILHKQNIEDVLDWWGNRKQLGELSAGEQRTRIGTYSAEKSLRKSKLRRIDLSEIDDNPEVAALKFEKVVMAELMVFGRRTSEGKLTNNPDDLAKAGRELLYDNFTREGISKRIEAGKVPFLAPGVADRVRDGAKQFTWSQVASAYTFAHDIKNAEENREGFPWLKAAFGDLAMEVYDKYLKPAGVDISDWTTEQIEELKATFWIEYGHDGVEAIKEYAGKGWSVVREAPGELKIWWKNSESALRLKKTGENTWEIIKTGALYPVKSTLYATDWATTELRDFFRGLEKERKRWMADEIEVTTNMYDETGRFSSPPNLATIATERRDMLIQSRVANGYKLFGKFERDFISIGLDETITPTGILAQPDLLEPDSWEKRFHMQHEEGYVNFVGIGADRNEAFQTGVKDLIRYLYKHQDKLEAGDFKDAVISGDGEALRDHVISYISRFGALKTQHNGYILCMHLPFPTNSMAESYTREIIPIVGKTVATKRFYAKYKNRYHEIKDREHQQENFDKFKHTLHFATKDDLFFHQYIEQDIFQLERFKKDYPEFKGHWVQQYMKEFGLWSEEDFKRMVGFALGFAEGAAIKNYGEYDNPGQMLFEHIKDHKKEFLAVYGLAKDANELMYRIEGVGRSKPAAAEFSNIHN